MPDKRKMQVSHIFIRFNYKQDSLEFSLHLAGGLLLLDLEQRTNGWYPYRASYIPQALESNAEHLDNCWDHLEQRVRGINRSGPNDGGFADRVSWNCAFTEGI